MDKDGMSGEAKLRRIMFTGPGGDPFTAFVALDDNQFSDLLDQEVFDLTIFAKHVLSVVNGHSPAAGEVRDAHQAFAQCYTGVHTGYSGRTNAERDAATESSGS